MPLSLPQFETSDVAPWATMGLLLLLLGLSSYVKILLPLAARKRWLRFSPSRIRRFYRIKPLPSDDVT
jgi:hypothetical protein